MLQIWWNNEIPIWFFFDAGILAKGDSDFGSFEKYSLEGEWQSSWNSMQQEILL